MDLDDTANVSLMGPDLDLFPTTNAAAQERQQSDHDSRAVLPLALKISSGKHAAPIPGFLHSQVAKMFETTFHLNGETAKSMVERRKCAVTGCIFNGFRTWGLFGASNGATEGSW